MISTGVHEGTYLCVQLNDGSQIDFAITARILVQSVYIYTQHFVVFAGNTCV